MAQTRTDDDYYELMRAERSRLNTFHNYPDDAAISPASLAAAGFFYTGRGTRVECAFCRGSVKEWTRTDDPATVHHNRFPHCQFIQQHRATSVSEDTRPANPTKPASSVYCQSRSSHDEPKSFRDCLMQSRDIIVQKLQHVDDIVEHLADDSISAISQAQCEFILSESKLRQKVRKLLDTLHQCGEEAVKQFLVALYFTEQREICQVPSCLALDLPSQPVDILSCDKFKTQLMQQYVRDIEERNRLESEQYGHVISLEQHEPVVITHGRKCPDEHLRRGFNEFTINRSDKKVVSFKQIFKLSPGVKRAHSILLLGGPGSGKTSLCYSVLNHSIKKQWLDEHEIIVFKKLKEIENLPDLSVSELLLDYGGVEVPQEKKRRVIEQLKLRQNRMLLVFDGYDEVSPFLKDEHLRVKDYEAKAKPLTIVANIVRGNLFPESQILVTSRSYGMQHAQTDVVCELAGLKEESTEHLMKQIVPEDVFSSIRSFLSENNDVMSLLAMPVNLQKFLAYIKWLAEDEDDIKQLASLFPNTKSSIYTSQIYPVLRQCLRREGIVSLGRKAMWGNEFVKNHLLKLCKLASLALSELGQRQILFSEKDLESCGLSDEMVKVCGFMTSFVQKKRTRDGVVSIILYIFTHLTNLEWVSGLHAIGSPHRFMGIFLNNRGQFDVLLCFAVGLLRHADGQQMIECIYDMSKEKCERMAHDIFSETVTSKRCRQKNGPQFCLELFFEGQFDDPTLIVNLLSPQTHVIEIADISLVNKAAVRYFFSKLSVWHSVQSEATNEINHLRLGFSQGAGIPVIRDMIAEAVTLQQLRTIVFPDAGVLREFSTVLTTATLVVNHDWTARVLRDILTGICSIESCRHLQIHKSSSIALHAKPIRKGESRTSADLELFHTEDRDIVGAVFGCLTDRDHVIHIEVKVDESSVALCVERDDLLPIIHHVSLTDRASDSVSDGCLRGLDSATCIVMKNAADTGEGQAGDVFQAPGATAYINITKDNIDSLPHYKRQQTDDNTASAVSSHAGDVSRLIQRRHAYGDDDHAITAAGFVNDVMSRHLASKCSILVDVDEDLRINEVQRSIAEFSKINPLEMVFLKGMMSNETVQELLTSTTASTICLMDTSVGYRRLSSSINSSVQDLNVIRGCRLHDDWTSCPSSLNSLSWLWYDNHTAHQVNVVIGRSPSLMTLGLVVLYDVSDSRDLMESLSALPRLTCLMLGVIYPVHRDLVSDMLRRLTALSELWLTFWLSPSDDDLIELSHLVSLSQNLHTISLFYCRDITPFVENLTASHLTKIYITHRTKLNTRSLVGFTGQIITVDHDDDVYNVLLCPVILSDQLLNNSPHVKLILKSKFKHRLLYPVT